MLRLGGVDVGRGSILLGRIGVTGPRRAARNVTIGRHCVVNVGCVLEAGAPIVIGDRVGLGQDVLVLTTGHAIVGPEQRWGPLESREVRIGEGSWIAARVTILPGVVIGEGSVVAAGSMVTESVPPQTLVAGVPARVIRSLG
jgi:maltose O-acetyltransferase